MLRTGLVAALVIALASAAPAQADPTFELKLAPDRVTPGETIRYTVTIRTGAEPERFALSTGPLRREDAGGRPQWPLVKEAGASYEGPGKAESNRASPGGPPPCSHFQFPSERGAFWEGGTLTELELPPNSTSTLSVAGHTAYNGLPARAPRIGETYGLGFTTFNETSGFTGGTLDAPGALSVPVAQPTDGVRGVWLTAATEPQTVSLGHRGAAGCPALGVLREPVTLRGRTDPPLPGQMVLIEGGPRSVNEPAILGRAVVREDGTFTFGPWRPPAAGDYELRVVYRSQSPQFADDQMEGARAFRYEPPVTVGRRAAVRRGVARVRISCRATTTPLCRGSLRLRRASATWGRKTFSVAPGKAQTVRVRLSRSARAVLARRRAVRVRVTVVQQGAPARTLRLSLRR